MKKNHLVFILLYISPVFASTSQIGEELSLLSIIPFCGILLSIAIFPLISPKFWHDNFGKIATFWSLIFIFPFTIWQGLSISIHKLFHVALLEYLPFIILLFSLYTISGGIRIKGNFSGFPMFNCVIIMIGTILASWIGTTGAAMLLIRPLLRANKWRRYKVHTIIFFIFLVANIGGSLSPLGDPPLFLGFLQGIDFFWTTKALFIPMLISSIILLIIYFLIDSYYFNFENKTLQINKNKNFKIDGGINIIILISVILSVLMSGYWRPGYDLIIMGVPLEIQNILRDVLLIILAYTSFQITSESIRKSNRFTWFPILEVAKLFAGIFITIIPVISILEAGDKGVLHFLINLVINSDGTHDNSMYFWLTGGLSAFLDNAPTYLLFFNIAGSSYDGSMIIAEYLMNDVPVTLLAISLGAVFMGSMTYIGNAPNFMIKSIAEENDVKMPSFIGYMIWSFVILIPLFYIISIIIF